MDYMGSLFADGIYKSDKLITNGPFSLVRNPIYSSYIILYPSLGIYGSTIVQAKYAIIQVIALLLFICLGGILLNYRITHEEKVLSCFGAEYTRYKAGTPRLLPTLTSLIGFMNQPFLYKSP